MAENIGAPHGSALLADSELAVLGFVGRNKQVTVSQVMEFLTEAGTPAHEASSAIRSLTNEGRIALRDTHPPSSLGEYVSSVYGAWFLLLAASVAAVLVSTLFVPGSSPFTYSRYVLASLMIFFLPGYALSEAIYPKQDALDGLERLALTIGLSITLVPLTGLALNLTPWGIGLDSIAASLSALTMAIAVLAAQRKLKSGSGTFQRPT